MENDGGGLVGLAPPCSPEVEILDEGKKAEAKILDEFQGADGFFSFCEIIHKYDY